MKIIRINHLGLAPKNPNVTKTFFGDLLGLNCDGSEVVPDQMVKVTFFDSEKSRLEVLEPTEDSSPVGKFIAERGGGIQHVALEVDNLEEWLSFLASKGVQLIDEKPRTGAHNTKIAFIHPRSTGGILVELTQENKGS